MVTFLVAIRITDLDTDPDPDPYRYTGKTYLGGGMHCPSASSFDTFIHHVVRHRYKNRFKTNNDSESMKVVANNCVSNCPTVVIRI